MDDERRPSRPDHDPARPDVVLFNGGAVRVAAAPRAAAGSAGRVGSLPATARGAADCRGSRLVLDNDRLDLAVARGAAYYGMVRRGQGVRIAAGLARTYYIGVEAAKRGSRRAPGRSPEAFASRSPLTAAPSAWCRRASSRGTTSTSPSGVSTCLVSEPAEFPLFVSSTRLTDKPGELVPIDREQMTPLPPIRTVLRTRKKGEAETVSVDLHARLTEIGTLDLWCSEIGGRRSWRLQFDVRSATQTDLAAHQSQAEGEGVVDEAIWQECQTLIAGHVRPRPATPTSPKAGQAAGGGHRQRAATTGPRRSAGGFGRR